MNIRGKNVVITGQFTQTRAEIKRDLERLGAHVKSSVTASTSLLIAGEKAGSKLKKAQMLGICVVGPTELSMLISGENNSQAAKRGHPSTVVSPAHSKAPLPPSKSPRRKHLSGLSFFLAGQFAVTKKKVKEDLIGCGAHVASNLSEKTDVMVAGNFRSHGSLAGARATEMGIPTLYEAQLPQLIGGASLRALLAASQEKVAHEPYTRILSSLETLRKQVGSTPSLGVWRSITEILDTCAPQRRPAAIKTVQDIAGNWPEWAIDRHGYRVRQRFQVAPPHWVGAMVSGKSDPMFQAVRDLYVPNRNFSATQLKKMLSCPDLTELRSLTIDYNKITAPVLKKLTQFSSGLRELSVNGQYLSVPMIRAIAQSNLHKLERLKLATIDGWEAVLELPSSIQRMQLDVGNVGRVHFFRRFLDHFGSLRELRFDGMPDPCWKALAQHPVGGQIERISSCRQVHPNKIEKYASSLTSLKAIELHHKNIPSGRVLARHLPNLEELYLYSLEPTRHLADFLATASSLHSLVLSGKSMTSTVFDALVSNKALPLEVLHLNSGFESPYFETLAKASCLQNLRALRVQQAAKLIEAIPFSRLEFLQCEDGDDIVEPLASAPNLRTLRTLYIDRISKEGARRLRAIPHLEQNAHLNIVTFWPDQSTLSRRDQAWHDAAMLDTLNNGISF